MRNNVFELFILRRCGEQVVFVWSLLFLFFMYALLGITSSVVPYDLFLNDFVGKYGVIVFDDVLTLVATGFFLHRMADKNKFKSIFIFGISFLFIEIGIMIFAMFVPAIDNFVDWTINLVGPSPKWVDAVLLLSTIPALFLGGLLSLITTKKQKKIHIG